MKMVGWWVIVWDDKEKWEMTSTSAQTLQVYFCTPVNGTVRLIWLLGSKALFQHAGSFLSLSQKGIRFRHWTKYWFLGIHRHKWDTLVWQEPMQIYVLQNIEAVLRLSTILTAQQKDMGYNVIASTINGYFGGNFI